MPRFRVDLSTLADVTTSVEVEADSVECAMGAAMQVARTGNALWEYQGADDTKIMITGVSKARG